MIDRDLFSAALNEDLEKIEDLIKIGHNVNLADDLSGENLLFKMISFNYEKVAFFLIDMGADVNNKNYGGKTVLMEAASKDVSLSLIKKLVESGADIHEIDKMGSNVLWWAGNDKIISYFISLGLGIKKRIGYIDNEDKYFKEYYIVKKRPKYLNL